MAAIGKRKEAARNLHALMLLAQDRAEGAWYFQQPNGQILRSFIAFFWCLPAQLFKWSLYWTLTFSTDERAAELNRFEFLFTNAILDLVIWLIFAVVVYMIITFTTNEPEAAVPVVIAANWFNLFGIYIFFIPAALMFIFPISWEIGGIMELLTYVLVLGLFYRVMKHMTGGRKLMALALTMANIFVGIAMTQLAYSIILS